MAKKEEDPQAEDSPLNKVAYNLKRPIPPFKSFRCNICGQHINNENFEIDDGRDCPVCDNKECLKVA